MSTPQAIARTILDGFEKRYAQFRALTAAAKESFERADWTEANVLNRVGIGTYDDRVAESVESVLRLYPDARSDETLWPQVKQAFIALLYDHKRPECAETFFNSVACRVLDRTYYRNEYIFWRPAVARPSTSTPTSPRGAALPDLREHPVDLAPTSSELRAVGAIRGFSAATSQADWRASRRHFARRGRARLRTSRSRCCPPSFFREQGGLHRSAAPQRQRADAVRRVSPPLRLGPGLCVDALLLQARGPGARSSASRSAYFIVDMDVPSAFVTSSTR